MEKSARKRYIIIATAAAIMAAAGFLLYKYENIGAKKQSSTVFTMDTAATIVTYGSDTEQYQQLLTSISDDLDAFSSTGSTGRFNNAPCGTQVNVSGDVYELINRTRLLSVYGSDKVSVSCGALTRLWDVTGNSPRVPDEKEIQSALSTIGDDALVTVLSDDGCILSSSVDGMMLDFGSVAKGYACDRLYELCKGDESLQYAVISLGSSSLLYGTKPDNEPFNVEIRNPDGNDTPLGYIRTKECFISTSGGYERYFETGKKKYCHIFDLSTGYPTESDLTSVTVIASNGTQSDYLSTLIFLEGTDGINRHLANPEFILVACDNAGNVYSSAGEMFTLADTEHYRMAEVSG